MCGIFRRGSSGILRHCGKEDGGGEGSRTPTSPILSSLKFSLPQCWRGPEGLLLKVPHTDGGETSRIFFKIRPQSSNPENKIHYTGHEILNQFSVCYRELCCRAWWPWSMIKIVSTRRFAGENTPQDAAKTSSRYDFNHIPRPSIWGVGKRKKRKLFFFYHSQSSPSKEYKIVPTSIKVVVCFTRIN